VNTRPTRLLLALLVLSGCAGHETLWVGDPPATWTAPAEPLPITVAVRTNSFESPRIAELGVGHRFAFELSRSGLVWGVRYAPEEPVHAPWELLLQARDHASEAAGNGRRATWARWFPPAAPFLWLERSSVLELDAELLEGGESRGRYAVRGEVESRYKSRANLQRVQLNGGELLMRNTIQLLLAELARDLPHVAAGAGPGDYGASP
jgi:hypothetical protein